MPTMYHRPIAQLSVVMLACLSCAAQAASWTQVTNAAPASVETMLLLTDGTVLAHSYDNPGSLWSKLTPAANGSYVNGTWSSVKPMGTGRIYFASHVLPNGNLWVLGGEYSGPNLDPNWTNTGEVYDTLTDTWTPIPSHPEPNYGDVPSMLLDGGKILAGSLTGRNTYLYDINTNRWSNAAIKAYNDSSDEEGWVKLPDGSVMTYDLFQSIRTNGAYAEVYKPEKAQWQGRSPSDGTASGSIPQLSSSAMGYEMGPALTLRGPNKRGTVLFLGATGHTASYDIASKTWTPGQDIKGTLNGKPALFGADDAPAAEMPSGHIVLAADAAPTLGLFSGPTQLFDYDPATQAILPLAAAFPVPAYLSGPAYTVRMLMLPNGQMMLSNGDTSSWIYTPDGKADAGSMPKPTALHYDGSGQFTLTGYRLTGVSAGSNYGDDAESDENYPIVRLTDGAGTVRYARSYDWSNTGVRMKKPQTVKFTLKAGTPAGNHHFVVSGAGVQSKALCVQITADQAAGQGAAADVALAKCTALH